MKCRCGKEIEKIQTILTSVDVAGPVEDEPEGEQYVVMTGYIERVLPCGHSLGEGYGDVDFFPTPEAAKVYHDKLKEKLGKVTEEG